MKRLVGSLISTVALAAMISQADAGKFDDFVKSAVKTVTKPATIMPEIIGDALKGKDIGKSAQNHAHQYLDAHKDMARVTADVHSNASKGARRAIRKVGGNALGDIADLALEDQERLTQHAAGLVGVGVELGKGKGITAIPAEILAAELRLAESTLLPVSKPLSEHVIEEMRKIYPNDVLNRARYVVGSKVSTNVAQILNTSLRVGENISNAVTVGRVIVFESEPGMNYRWWAHELGHVQQYMEMGFDGFARAYVKNRSAIERDADHRAGITS